MCRQALIQKWLQLNQERKDNCCENANSTCKHFLNSALFACEPASREIRRGFLHSASTPLLVSGFFIDQCSAERERYQMIEFKVRPVSRYNVTKYESAENGTGSCETIGEFQNLKKAETVALAMSNACEGSILNFGDIESLGNFPCTLRNIANDAENMITPKRGLVFIELENGNMFAYGLGKEIGDFHDLAAKGLEAIEELMVSPD